MGGGVVLVLDFVVEGAEFDGDCWCVEYALGWRAEGEARAQEGVVPAVFGLLVTDLTEVHEEIVRGGDGCVAEECGITLADVAERGEGADVGEGLGGAAGVDVGGAVFCYPGYVVGSGGADGADAGEIGTAEECEEAGDAAFGEGFVDYVCLGEASHVGAAAGVVFYHDSCYAFISDVRKGQAGEA